MISDLVAGAAESHVAVDPVCPALPACLPACLGDDLFIRHRMGWAEELLPLWEYSWTETVRVHVRVCPYFVGLLCESHWNWTRF